MRKKEEDRNYNGEEIGKQREKQRNNQGKRKKMLRKKEKVEILMEGKNNM